MIKLISYLVAAILSWSPAANHPGETAEDYTQRVRSIARDIADVAVSESSPFTDDEERVKSATLLAAVAFWESNFQWWVDDATCNDPAKLRAARVGWTGACDGGIAVSMWQIHPEFGFILLDDGGWRWRNSTDSEDAAILRKDMFDRRIAARVALHLLRQSIRNGGGLCGYSGESGPCPKANLRLDFARRWWSTHSPK